MARRAAAAGLVSLALAFAIWSGCQGSSTSGARGGTGGAAGQAAEAGVDASGAGGAISGGASGAGGDAAVDAGPPYPGAQACPGHPGWFASPNMPAGCFYTCIPDDVTARVPALKWDDRSDWCPGCKWLEPRWWPGAKPDNAAPVVPDFRGFGPGPDTVMLEMWLPDKSVLVAMYGQDGTPVLGITGAKDATCALDMFAMGQDGETVGARYAGNGDIYSNQRWMLRPMDQASELMLDTKPDFTYSDAFIGQNTPNQSFFTRDWIVEAFGGNFMSMVDVKAGTAQKVAGLPGAPPGEYDSAVISGNAVFVEAFTDRSSWFVVQNGVAKPFLGGASVDIDRFATDGKWIVWNEGTQLVPDPADPSRMLAQRHDLYRTPFTTDATKIQRQLLVPNTPRFYGTSRFANGHFTDITLSRADGSAAVHSQAWVAEVDTGRVWTSDLPQGYVWGGRNYPTPTELWGAISPGHYNVQSAYTIARVPYAEMTQIQAAMP